MFSKDENCCPVDCTPQTLNTSASEQQARTMAAWLFDFELRAGFLPPAEIADRAFQIAASGCSEDLETLRLETFEIVNILAAGQRTIEAEWPKITDCDRLDNAFADMVKDGYICRQHFCCCEEHASRRIDDAILREEDLGREFKVAVFYSKLATDHAMKGKPLAVSYCGKTESRTQFRKVGKSFVEALRRHGLNANWDGDVAKTIQVEMVWRRRLPVVPQSQAIPSRT